MTKCALYIFTLSSNEWEFTSYTVINIALYFSIITLMAINKSTVDVPQRPHLHLHHQNQTTREEWKKTCYNFTAPSILLNKCLINLCQHTYETKIKNTDSLTPGVGYGKIVLLQ